MDSGPRSNASQEDVVALRVKWDRWFIENRSSQEGLLFSGLPSSMSIEGFRSFVVVSASSVSDGGAFLGRLQSFGELCFHCCKLVHVHSKTSTMISLKTSVCCQNMPGWTFLASEWIPYLLECVTMTMNFPKSVSGQGYWLPSLFRIQNETLGGCWSLDLKHAMDLDPSRLSGLGSGNGVLQCWWPWYRATNQKQFEDRVRRRRDVDEFHHDIQRISVLQRIGCTCPLDQLYVYLDLPSYKTRPILPTNNCGAPS